jgi:hypothetical protein
LWLWHLPPRGSGQSKAAGSIQFPCTHQVQSEIIEIVQKSSRTTIIGSYEMRRFLQVVVAVLVISQSLLAKAGITVETPKTYSGLHWTVTGVPSLSTCSKITDVFLELTGVDSSFTYTATGRLLCNTPSGPINIVGIGTGLVLSSGRSR